MRGLPAIMADATIEHTGGSLSSLSSVASVGVEGRDRGSVEKAFARHETFHLRYGWLKKGFDASVCDPSAFVRADAALQLGVGKNMVRAIRYWCRAFKVTEEVPDPAAGRVRLSEPTAFGTRLLGEYGWDPYLENPASLWLLHWQLLQAPCRAPSWYAMLNGAYIGTVTDADLLREVALMRDAQPGWGDVVDASLKKDVDCFLRMYAPRRERGKSIEDSLDSPFATLGLIAPVKADRHLYSFNIGVKEGLADEVVVFAILDFLRRHGRSGARTALISRFVQDENSPGRIFKLTESDLRDAVLRVSASDAGIELSDAAGSLQLVLRDEIDATAERLLDTLYRGGAPDVAPTP